MQSEARFSARLDAVEVKENTEAIEVSLVFSDVDGALHGVAACRWAATWPQDADLGVLDAPGPVFIGLELEHWAHDAAFDASILTETLAVTRSETASLPTATSPAALAASGEEIENDALQLALAAYSLDSRGALIGIGLPEPRPFAVRADGDRVILEIAQPEVARFPPSDDPLGEEAGDSPTLDGEVFWLEDGAIYHLEDASAQVISTTLATITDMTIDPIGTQLVVCAHEDAMVLDQPPALWLIEANGTNPRLLADVGGCAEPAVDPSGQRIAFVAPANGTDLPQVWTVPLAGGEATPLQAGIDPWSRSSPLWIDERQLVYAAGVDDNVTLLMINQDGVESELSARLLTGSTYRRVGTFVVDPATELIAVQALHANDEGSDLVLLRTDGTTLATEQRGFSQQPLGFSDDGLWYLTIECPSGTVQRYALRQRSQRGAITTSLSGNTVHTVAAASVQDDVLVYVRYPSESREEPVDGSIPQPSNEIRMLTDDGDARALLHQTSGMITDIVQTDPILP